MGDAESADFLDDFRNAVSRRSRALKHRLGKPPELSEIADGPSIRLELGRSPTLIAARIWPDRAVWLDARRKHKTGWLWAHSFSAFLADDLGADILLKRIEEFSNLIPLGPNDEPSGDILRESLFADGTLLEAQ